MGIVNYGSGQVIGFISENSIDRFKLNKENSIKWEIPGYVHIDGYRYSPFLQFIKNSLALLIREIDF